jgi:hypothetical protein
MPTYKNTSNIPITKLSTTFLPGKAIQTYYIFDDDPNLQKVSEAPYFNPVILCTDITFTSNQTNTVTLDISTPAYVQIYNVIGSTLKVFFNTNSKISIDVYTVPPVILKPNNKFSIYNYRTIKNLILEMDSAGSCTLMVRQKTIGLD